MQPVPQFGVIEPARAYADRAAAFGIVSRGTSIALVKVAKPGFAPWWDLPGGAVDPGETEAQALVREFGEETGLRVQAGACFCRADQYFVNTEGAAYNNRAGFWTVEVEGEAAGLKIEDDHELVWTAAEEALVMLRHDAHAWAVAAWLRRVRP